MTTKMQPERPFPLQNKDLPSIPWAMIAPHERQARENHYQSLERLAVRGGLSATEAVDILSDKPWDGRCFSMPDQRTARDRCEAEAVAELRRRVETWQAEANTP